MELKNPATGVSVIICCHNSASRLRPTLAALSKQEFTSALDWEIIIVDNASTDFTGNMAIETWESFTHRPALNFRVIEEKKTGLGYARSTGISQASFQFILFCDDDNWLSENYVQGVYNILDSDDSIAACGGLGIPEFETKKPFWFDLYAEAFAVGNQNITFEDGQLLNLYGAGLAINTQALKVLYQSGFKPLMTGRTGSSLSSSEDTELTYAFVLLGYKLYYTPQLTFLHFLPQSRLEFSYLKKIFRAFGKDGPVRGLYYGQITKRFFHPLVKYWYFHLSLCLVRLVKYMIKPPKKFGRSIYLGWSLSYIRELIAIRGNYENMIDGISNIRRRTPIARNSMTFELANL